jgi:serine protease
MRKVTPWVLVVLTAFVVRIAWTGWSTVDPVSLDESPAEADDEAAAASDFDLLVDYRDGVGADTLAATPWQEEALSDQTARDGLYRIRFDSAADARRAAQELRANPAVESVDWDAPATLPPDETMDQTAFAQGPTALACDGGKKDEDGSPGELHKGFPDDPCYKFQWHLRQVGLPDAWKLGRGEGVVVAVIDTGVTQVPDLKATDFVPGYNFVANNANAADDHGHGTHVAGTIAQATHNKVGVAGVAFGAKIMPLKVLSAQGSGSMGAIAQAIRYAADHGAKVINMSLGGPFPVSAIHSAVKYARGKGVVVVAAAGNDGRGRVSYPARYPEVFAVAATQFDESTTFYSNWGAEVDIAAPGGNTKVDQNGDGFPDGVLQNTVTPGNIGKVDYLWFMGTSMASPHTAGVAALVMGAGVNKPDAVENLLRATARKPKKMKETVQDANAGTVEAAEDASRRVDDHYGAGIIDAGAALRKTTTVKGAGGLGLGAALGLLGLAGLRRRGRLAALGWSAPAGLVVGASGLFFLPLLVGLPGPLAFLGVSITEAIPATFSGLGLGNPLLLSAALPFAAVALLAGVQRLRPVLGGLAFGVAGALALVAVTAAVDVAFVPNAVDRLWLLLNVAACVLLGRAVLRK